VSEEVTSLEGLARRVGDLQRDLGHVRAATFDLVGLQYESMALIGELLARLGADAGFSNRLSPNPGSEYDLARLSVKELDAQVNHHIDKAIAIMRALVKSADEGAADDR
jgi:hypothetical protein